MDVFFNQFTIMAPFVDAFDIPYRVAVNPAAIDAVRQMILSQPVINMSLKTFQDSIFVEAFEVIFGNKDQTGDEKAFYGLKPEIQASIIAKYWMPWLRQVDTMTTAYGYCPFYYKPIKHQVRVEPEDQNYKDIGDSDDLVPINKKQLFKDVLLKIPISPTIDMGITETFIYKKEQHLIWKWGTIMGPDMNGKYDTEMFFIVEDMPTLTGNLTSRLSTLLPDYEHLKTLRRQDSSIVSRMANVQHAIEYSPNISGMLNEKDQNYVDGQPHPNSFFPTITVGALNGPQQTTPGDRIQNALGAVQQFQEGIRGNNSSSSMGRINAGLDPSGSIYRDSNAQRSQDSRTDALDKFALYIARNPEMADMVHVAKNKLENALYLNPYERYVPIHTPASSISDQVMSVQANFERIAGSVLNSPLNITSGIGMGKTGESAIQSQENVMHQRVRYRIKFFCSVVKQVFKLAFLTMFERARSDLQRFLKYHIQNNMSIEKILDIERALDFSIVFKPASTNLEFMEIAELYGNGVLTEDEAYNIYFSKIGFTDPPLKAPDIFKKQMKQNFRAPPPEEQKAPGAAGAKRPREEDKGKDKDKKAAKKQKKE